MCVCVCVYIYIIYICICIYKEVCRRCCEGGGRAATASSSASLPSLFYSIFFLKRTLVGLVVREAVEEAA